jgi:ABC-type sugar transport system ATPase subunit
VANSLAPQERNVAMVFQDYALYPHLTARGNLEFPLRMRRLSRDARRQQVDAIATLLGIADLLERLPRQLSGGQRQRVAMGRALVREPSVFLLDEPLSNLDAKLRVQVRAEIKDLQRRTGTTMLYVTHDQVEAMTLGDRVVVLRDGALEQVAPPRALYDRPASAFVAGFVGNPPMNLFPARLAAEGDRLRLAVGDQMVSLAGGERLRAHVGRPLTAGLRPEALRLADAGGAAARLQATLVHIECLGHETLAHAAIGGDAIRLVARLAGMPSLTPGATASLGFDPSALYLFAADGTLLLPP